ncbi:MAG: DUF350 domain-containing protein [Bryobacteraceae bacterium]|jgi:uncharacterized membrane protein YjfL (UPF0719 family)
MTEFPFLNALVYTVAGVLAFLAAFALAVRLAPLDFWRQIVEERNVAAAILAAGVALALGWIVAATLH